ncbi:MAG: S-methyl-5'-thioadenosine phosphorylase [Alphaproteobacteria bacterium]|jgi:5'-methylthioadenosine phosphorylase|nr:S-methyl-5'-thioadenosine phosphorylase [Rhodospirillaceae bacterium]MBT6202912.1 S-methyl-5'-thioadenosine phosphorylase [Rhodospirillaceae bacterium]MBT6509706.1 S-methyl-5'-thioadenosine phosphorylase [Rhodospirillaceae bacterium]MDG2480964.1 S-methyl-5'-thioadenosine phosphorylase [Alphaproteobacteria bacterium]
MTETVLGVLGGSGVYDIDGLEDARWTTVETPWGAPSDQLLQGVLDGQRIVFLPRHGRGHPISPTGINARANIDALKRLSVTDLISVASVGSFREELAPGTFVICDQYVDRTNSRERSFFGNGCVAHVSLAHPTCDRLADHVAAAGDDAGLAMVRGGNYLCIEGPQFSTLAESNLFRSWGMDVIGMTAMPEARLAREAELCYLTVAMVTDYDCWHEDHGAVTVDKIIEVLHANADNAHKLVRALAPRVGRRDHPCGKGCDRALDFALITPPDHRDATMQTKLDAVAGRVLG